MDNLVIATTCTFPHEAHMIKSYLDSNGIETFLEDDMTVQVNVAYSNAVGGVKLLVKESDYDKSILLLKEGGYIIDENVKENSEDEVTMIEYSTDQKTCPFCQSENIGTNKSLNSISRIFSTFLSVITFSGLDPIYKSEYICFDCYKKWKYKK